MNETRLEENASGDERARYELARKLNLLLDAFAAERGNALTYKEIAAVLDARGVRLSRARWSYMLSGSGYLVTDESLLRGLAEYFDVDPEYLLGGPGVPEPERVIAMNEMIIAIRAAKVKNFAARTLGEVSPPTLKAITELLNQVIGEADDEDPEVD